MKAARYYGKEDLRIEEVDVPELTADDELLIEVALCGICGTDLHEFDVGPIVTPTEPHPLTGAVLPQTMGHEFGGRVVDAGSGVTRAGVGDRVAIMPAIVCGTCYHCRRGNGHLCARFACTGLSSETGGLSQYAVVKDYQVATLPDDVSDTEGALIEPASVAAYGVERAGVTGGDTVLVTGAGPIGLLSALYASAVGAATVIISEVNPQRLKVAGELGLGPTVTPDQLESTVAELTAGVGVDLAVECSGTTPGLTGCLDNVRRSGAVVQTGLHTKPATIDAMQLSEKDVSLHGSWCWRITDWDRTIRLVASGKYPVAKAVSSTIPLDDVVDRGFRALLDPEGHELKVLVDPR